MTANTRANPGKKVRPVIQRLMHNHIQTNHGWRKEAAEAVRRGLGDSDEWEGGGTGRWLEVHV